MKIGDKEIVWHIPLSTPKVDGVRIQHATWPQQLLPLRIQSADRHQPRQPVTVEVLRGPASVRLLGQPVDSSPDVFRLVNRGPTGLGNAAPGGEPIRQVVARHATDTLPTSKATAVKGKENDIPVSAESINILVQQVAGRTRLSTTGYQMAMDRVNNQHRSDGSSLMTLSRARDYLETAKLAFPTTETLKNLAELQQSQIYRTASGELRGAIEMSVDELTQCLQRCRASGFANCDMQALEVGLHLRHDLGITNFKVVSNTPESHNYVVIDPSETFPKGAIVDTWTGLGLQPLDFKIKLKLRHFAANFTVNSNMHEWIEKHGAEYARMDAPRKGPELGAAPGNSK